MILKKFYGDTVKKARKKAFAELGEHCIVLESREASGKTDACVTVMLDGEKEEILKDPSKKKKRQDHQTYTRKDLLPNSLNTVKKAIHDGFNRFSSEADLPETQKNNRSHSPENSVTSGSGNKTETREHFKNNLQNSNAIPKEESSGFEQNLSEYMHGNHVSKEVKALHRRFDHMEKLLSEALVSSNIKYVSHPAFQQLLNSGIQATTVSSWFQQILEKGIDPLDQSTEFMKELAQLVRKALSFGVQEKPVKNMLFVGPPGAGKTSLIMKLAAHPDFMGNKRVGLVSVEPADHSKHYSPLALFAQDVKLPYYTVRNGVEVGNLLSELDEFDHILFDSPPISLQHQDAFRKFWKIRQILSSVTPLEVHYTINATLRQCYFRKNYTENNFLQPDYVAITHLDETDQWGQLVPFINELGVAVRYVSHGPQVPEHIRPFQNEWFAEKIVSTT